MIAEETYSYNDLESGTCRCCGEQSDEILKDDGRCIDCIEKEKFIGMTMSDWDSYDAEDLDDW